MNAKVTPMPARRHADMPAFPIDTGRAHPARVYDHWLGGKDNYACDRKVGDAMTAQIPETPQSCLDNRGFLIRAVQHLATEEGIRQFLDIGSGLPTSPNIHEVAQDIDPRARVVYVDNDPIVHLHGQSLLTSTPQGATGYIHADLRRAEQILHQATQTLDSSRPVALVLAALLHFIPENHDPAGIVRRLMDPLPSGSALILSHMTGNGADENYVQYVKQTWASGGVTMHLRDREHLGVFFNGLDLLEPGIVPVHQWRPQQEDQQRPRWWLWSGVALKP